MNLGLVQTRPAGGAGVSDHSLLSNLDYPSAGHTAFCSLATPQTITAQKLIDSTVGLRFGHAAGPLLQGPAAGDDLTLTGDLKLSGVMGVLGTTPDAATGIKVNPTSLPTTFTGIELSPSVSGMLSYIGLKIAPVLSSVQSGGVILGISGNAVGFPAAGVTMAALKGLSFKAAAGLGQNATITEVTAAEIQVINANPQSGLTYTTTRGLRVMRPTGHANLTMPTIVGVDIDEQSPFVGTLTTVYGLRIADITRGTNRYLIEAGPATPNLRLLGGAPPNAGLATEGDSQAYLAWMENGVLNLRQVRWRQQSSLLATDKVLIAA